MNQTEGISEIFDMLNISSLKALVDKSYVSVADRRSRLQIIEALEKFYVSLDAVLIDLTNAELKEICDIIEVERGLSRLEAINNISDYFNNKSIQMLYETSQNNSTPWNSSKYGRTNLVSNSYENSYQSRDDSERENQTKKHRTVFWYLFVMPGMAMTWIEYMFPSRGNVYASGRRKDNTLVHVIYSLGIWAFVSYITLAIVANHKPKLNPDLPIYQRCSDVNIVSKLKKIAESKFLSMDLVKYGIHPVSSNIILYSVQGRSLKGEIINCSAHVVYNVSFSGLSDETETKFKKTLESILEANITYDVKKSSSEDESILNLNGLKTDI
jgi:hypothetical protein